jgi:hypothetical protein
VSTFRFLGISAVVLASGCAIAPYEQSFQCPLSSDFGSCIDVEGAYDDAVADPASHSETADRRAPSTAIRARRGRVGNAIDYVARSERVSEPASPAVTPPSLLRTLVLGYQDADQTLFAPRFVFQLAGEWGIRGADEVPGVSTPARASVFPLREAAR